jgi:hypothetical protein
MTVDAVGGSLGDVQPGSDVAQPHPRVAREDQQHTPVVTQESPAAHVFDSPRVSKNKLPASICGRWVIDDPFRKPRPAMR